MFQESEEKACNRGGERGCGMAAGGGLVVATATSEFGIFGRRGISGHPQFRSRRRIRDTHRFQAANSGHPQAHEHPIAHRAIPWGTERRLRVLAQNGSLPQQRPPTDNAPAIADSAIWAISGHPQNSGHPPRIQDTHNPARASHVLTARFRSAPNDDVHGIRHTHSPAGIPQAHPRNSAKH